MSHKSIRRITAVSPQFTDQPTTRDLAALASRIEAAKAVLDHLFSERLELLVALDVHQPRNELARVAGVSESRISRLLGAASPIAGEAVA